MRSLKRFFAIVSAAVVGLCGIQVPQKASAETEKEEKRIVVSLGDSYSSGEGIDPFYGKTKNEFLESGQSGAKEYLHTEDARDWLAHRSQYSWPGQLKVGGIDGTLSDHHNDNWCFVAASGAEIKNLGVEKSYLDDALAIINKKIDEQLKSGTITESEADDESAKIDEVKGSKWEKEKQKKYVSLNKIEGDDKDDEWEYETVELPYQLDVFNTIEEGTVDYVTLTLSGNDVGFTEVVEKATLGWLKPNETTDLLNSKITLFDDKIKYYLYSAYSAIQDKAGGQAKIIVAGYPKLFGDRLLAPISPKNREIVNNYITKFNDRIEEVVNDCRIYGGMNIYFVSVEDAFNGHGAYSDEEYIRGIMVTQSEDLNHGDKNENGDLNLPVSAYSIHPNKEGAKAYAEAVQKKITELEDNGMISGIIYEERPDTPVSDIASRIEKITAVNYDTGYKKAVYVDPAENTTFGKWRVSGDVGAIGNDSTGDDEGFSKLETKNLLYYSEDQISSTGHYEMVLPPGNYQLEVTCCDGTLFTLMDPNDPEQAEVVEVKARDVIKTKNIYLTEQEFGEPGSSYSWALEPSVEAEDINVVNECAYNENYGWFIQSDYSLIKQDDCYGVISNQGEIVVSPKYTRASGELEDHFVLEDSSDDHRTYDMFCSHTNSVTPDSINRCENCDILSTTFYGTGYYYDENRKLLLSTTLESHNENNEGNVYGIDMNGQNYVGFVDIADTVIARKATFSTDSPDYTPDATYTLEMLFGAVRNNEPISQFIYEDATDFRDGIAALCLDGKWGYINEEGETLIPFEFDGDFVYTYPYEETRYEYDQETGEKNSYNYVMPEEKMAYLPSEGYIALNKGDDAGYYDINGNEIIPVGTFAEARPVHNGLAWVKDKETGLWGVIDLEPADQTVDTEPETQEPFGSAGWKSIYREKLLSLIENGWASAEGTMSAPYFYLIDIDKDTIPELVTVGGSYGTNYIEEIIYSVYENEISEFEIRDKVGMISFLSDKHIVKADVGSAMSSEEKYYLFENGVWTETTAPKNAEEEYYTGTTYQFDEGSIDEAINSWGKNNNSSLQSGQEETHSEPDKNWKQLYYNTLKNDFSDLLSNPYAHFDIADLNNDGIPELLVSAGESHFQCVKIYTVYDGEACYVGEIGNYGTIRYNSEKNCILTGFIHMGYEYFEVYKIDEGKLIDITGGKNDTYSKDAPPYIYQIDGEDVTEEEYDRVCREYGYYGDDENVIYYGTTYEFTQESIDEVLSTGKPVSESEGITPEEAEFIGSWKCKAYYADGENVTDEVIEYFNEDYEEKCSISEMIEIEINDDHTAVVYVGNRSENHECSWRMSKNTLVLFDDEDPDETIILEKMNRSATTIKVTWDEDEEYALFEKS